MPSTQQDFRNCFPKNSPTTSSTHSAFRPLRTVECFKIRILIQVVEVTVNGKKLPRFFFVQRLASLCCHLNTMKCWRWKQIESQLDIGIIIINGDKMFFYNLFRSDLTLTSILFPLCLRKINNDQAVACCLLSLFFAHKSR